MPKKIILDCDPGIDDALAICLALFDPRLDLVAVTATAGNVSAEQATANSQVVIEQLDPPRYPRVGAASAAEGAPTVDNRHLHGEDGLGNAGFMMAHLQHRRPSEKIICDEVRAAPGLVTIVCLGPLTNIARAFQRDPELPTLVDRLVIAGGSVEGIGNVTPAAEFNMYADPGSAQAVFRSPTTKTLVPLDVTGHIRFTLDLLDQLPPDTTRAGVFLRRVLPFFFRAFHQSRGQESIFLHDVVALISVLTPELFETREMAGDVETVGLLTAGVTVFDRRSKPQWRPNMEVVTKVQVEELTIQLARGLQYAGQCTR